MNKNRKVLLYTTLLCSIFTYACSLMWKILFSIIEDIKECGSKQCIILTLFTFLASVQWQGDYPFLFQQLIAFNRKTIDKGNLRKPHPTVAGNNNLYNRMNKSIIRQFCHCFGFRNWVFAVFHNNMLFYLLCWGKVIALNFCFKLRTEKFKITCYFYKS